ncbi:hypothetical protein MD484_g3380, partial [Candolleomyces efflorescens]
MFTKNTNRTLKTWHKMGETVKDDSNSIEIGSSSESDENASPRSRKRARKRSVPLPVPKWQQDKNILRMLSAEPVSEGSDSDIAELSDPLATPKNSRRESKRRKQRQRSRSRSLTPPPLIPLQQVENVRKFVREALGPSDVPTIDLDDSTITLDPELELIVQRARQQTPYESQAANTSSDDPEDVVDVVVLWKPHPQAQNGQELKWEYKMNRTDNFHELFEGIAEDAQVVVSNLVVCHHGKRIFASVGPSVLNIWKEVEFTAYTKAAFEYIRAHPDLSAYNDLSSTQPQTQAPPTSSSSSSSFPTFDISDSDEDVRRPTTQSFQSQTASQSQSQSQRANGAESQSEAEDDDDKLKLTFRSAKTGQKDIILTVRPTAKCGNILRAFLRKAGLEQEYPEVFAADGPPPPPTRGKRAGKKAAAATLAKDPRLCVDGDKLDNESPISEADLEDGDLVEVVGL